MGPGRSLPLRSADAARGRCILLESLERPFMFRMAPSTLRDGPRPDTVSRRTENLVASVRSITGRSRPTRASCWRPSWSWTAARPGEWTARRPWWPGSSSAVASPPPPPGNGSPRRPSSMRCPRSPMRSARASSRTACARWSRAWCASSPSSTTATFVLGAPGEPRDDSPAQRGRRTPRLAFRAALGDRASGEPVRRQTTLQEWLAHAGLGERSGARLGAAAMARQRRPKK